MKRIAMVAAVLAMVLAVAVPAIAQVTQAPAETFVSGTNTNNAGSVTSGGSNSNTCAVQQGFNNSGGLLNQQEFQQYSSQSGGLIFLGNEFNNRPAQTAPCTEQVQQSAAASSGM